MPRARALVHSRPAASIIVISWLFCPPSWPMEKIQVKGGGGKGKGKATRCVRVYLTPRLHRGSSKECTCLTYLGMPPIFSLLDHTIDIFS